MNRRRLNLSRQPDPITWNSKRGSMKLTVKPIATHFFIFPLTETTRTKPCPFPLSACHFDLVEDAGASHPDAHCLVAAVFRFENEYQPSRR